MICRAAKKYNFLVLLNSTDVFISGFYKLSDFFLAFARVDVMITHIEYVQ